MPIPRSFRRAVMLLLASGTLLAALSISGTSHATTPGRKAPPTTPSVLVIMTDDQRWDTLDVMPHVQELLADKGVTFANAYAVNPICCPSRASFLTGNYSHTTGVYTNSKWEGSFGAFDDASTLATWLKPTHATAYFGKYLNHYREAGEAGYVPPGWDHWAAYLNGNYLKFEYTIDGVPEDHTGLGEYATDDLADKADAFIRGTAEPVFIFFAPLAPHNPPTPAPQDADLFSDLPPRNPPSFNEKNFSDKPVHGHYPKLLNKHKQREIQQFRIDQLRTLQAVDRAVEQLVTALQDTGRLDNTLILFTTDNGHFWGEHRSVGKNMAYEEGERLPFVVRYDPGVSDPGSTTDQLVGNIDLAPTVREITGVTGDTTDGVSLTPLLAGGIPAWRDQLLIEHASRAAQNPSFCQVHGNRYTLIAYADSTYELYDLQQDPYELQNIYGNHRYHKRQTRLAEHLRELCDPLPPAFPRKALP